MRWKKVSLWGGLVVLCAITIGIAAAVVEESRSSRWQAEWLSELARELHYDVQPGASAAIRFPAAGPFDRRLGYQQLPGWIERLSTEGYTVSAQARMSPRMLELSDLSLFPAYHEKTQAGLELLDCRGESLFSARYPLRVYERFEALPHVLVASLLFIENRELFDPHPTRNPAIEWKRLGRAALDQLMRQFDSSLPTAGGSTLATQIEKFRHSPGGRTDEPRDKLIQIASASVRSYLDGPDTRKRRQQIVVDYLNSVPLSARAGFGEVIGLGDAMWVWYGRDFDEVNRLLRLPIEDDGATPTAELQEQVLAVKQALSLLVAQRRPAYYLSEAGSVALRELTDAHLRLMADAGVVSVALRNAALPLPLALQLRRYPLADSAPSFVDVKASTALRSRLRSMLSLRGFYDLDRLDLRVDSSYSASIQHDVSAVLSSLASTEGARKAGLFGPHMLREGDDPSRIAFSFTLFESSGTSNLLRVQTDSVDLPFDLNEGARLDLGSTAKLRTLITYLEQVAALHRRWSGFDRARLEALKLDPKDAISRWARSYLAQASDRSLAAMLEAAMQRTYSASPTEGFFTGGGLHRFGNFEARDNRRTMTVHEALTRSVNLVFVRLMRDVVHHVMAGSEAIDTQVLASAEDPRRREYLERFADEEGSIFIARFFRKYASLTSEAAESLLMKSVRSARVPVASVFFGLEPDAGVPALQFFLARWLPDAVEDARGLHASHGPGRWSLSDRGYLAGVHPLELWVAGYLRRQPAASLDEALAASRLQRQEAYTWLFKTRNKGAQDRRIRDQLEVHAFAEIQRAWQRLGYPFQTLTPSYATAIGASGDRPSALAELMGIVVNGGMRLPVTRLQALDFARGTPYETRLEFRPAHAQRVLDAEVADVVRRALVGVVEEGTGRRLKGALQHTDGSEITIAGKTGTGDHRFDVRGPGGKLISSRVVNRSATLVFLIGERYYGTIMAFAHEPYAANYSFTSSLPTQLLKVLGSALLPLVDAPRCTALAGGTPGGAPSDETSARYRP